MRHGGPPSDGAAAPSSPPNGVSRRPAYRLGERLPSGEAVAAALKARPAGTTPPLPSDPAAAAARRQALLDAADQAAYDAMVADVTAAERQAAARSGTRIGDFRQQLALGAHVTVASGTGFAVGWVAAGAVWRHEAKRPIGGLIGLTAALILEVVLIVLHTRPRRGGSDRSHNRATPTPAHHPPQSVLDAEAEVAALVVAGAVRDVQRRQSEEGAVVAGGDKKND